MNLKENHLWVVVSLGTTDNPILVGIFDNFENADKAFSEVEYDAALFQLEINKITNQRFFEDYI